VFLGEKKLKVVIIDYPILAMADSICAVLMGKIFKMKFDGYAATYNDKIIPIDKTDFFGTHIALCEETKDGVLEPIFAYRSVSLARCNEFALEFPALYMMKNDGHPSCVEDINKIIANEKDLSSISYDSSWAQDLTYRFSSNPEIKETLREIMTTVIVMHHKEFKIPHMITCGVVKVKTDRFFLSIGLKKLNENAHFIENGMTKEECVVFYTKEFSFEAKSLAKKYETLWNSKMVIDPTAVKKKAVA
jgi:hypothetical protein